MADNEVRTRVERAQINISIKRPALRYFGGKFRLAPWVAAQFPPHVCYVEPFGGAAGVLLRKEASMFEIYNDLDGAVVNFFRVLRDRPEELLRAISLTPYSREEQLLSFEEGEEVDPVERARRLYVRCWQSHGGGRTQWRTGWRYQVNNTRGRSVLSDWNEAANLNSHLDAIVTRLKKVQIENDDAMRVIQRFDRPDTLFYVDPPYLATTRSKRWRLKAYSFEIDEGYHRRLAENLNTIKGMAIMSGKPSDLYEELYQGWEKVQRTCPTDFQARTVEVLWLSPAVVKRQRQMRLEI